MSELKPIEDEDDFEDDYKGAEGWVEVAVGRRNSIIMDIDPGLGALRWECDESGTDDCDDLGVMAPAELGVYRARFRYWGSRTYEGDYDSGYTRLTDWDTKYVSDAGTNPICDVTETEVNVNTEITDGTESANE